MSAQRGRPKVIEGETVEVRAGVPREIANAIDAVVAGSGGMSRATVLRQIIVAGLQPFAVISPEVAAALTPTPYGKKRP